ncbi:MAG: hypothetical protein AAAB35_18135 [Phyllobacterium sp.]|uniref:DUF7210 family protein n=1 Tax=Phyllobacterium sp. TaxID=1871046 RepID=UPI0030F20A36
MTSKTPDVTTSPSPGVTRTTTGATPAGAGQFAAGETIPDKQFTQNTGRPGEAQAAPRVGQVEGAEGVYESANVLPLYEVTLLKPHTHGREDFPIGATIKVNAAQRDWLIAQGVISADTLEN